MCGIAGIISERPDLASQLQAMSDRIVHRGPDDEGYLLWDGQGPVSVDRTVRPLPNCLLGMAHRRLSILDLSEAAWQPMSSSDGRWHLVFNGEIYNYVELRSELEKLGNQFTSSGDTAVLLAALKQWGMAALPRLVGMFAFALLDTQQRKLFLARDPFGIKPLFYTCSDGHFSFASETKALWALTDHRFTINPTRLFQYLRFGITDHGSQTLVKNMNQVPAASYLEVAVDNPADIRCETYWRLDPQTRHDLSEEEAAEELKRLFLESVQLHLRSDVAVGAALSGGIDSSAIVCAMRQLGGNNLDLNTITYIAPGSELDEEHFADIAALSANANRIKTSASSSDLTSELEALIEAQDEPFGSTSIFAQRRVFQAAADAGIKVMLDGQGADELLGGYQYFVAARLASLVRQGKFIQAFQLLQNVQPPIGYSSVPP
ncbi:MAG: asparagine synthase (glutamine-hydrolyzing), partial [Planctomycetales bacterium]